MFLNEVKILDDLVVMCPTKVNEVVLSYGNVLDDY